MTQTINDRLRDQGISLPEPAAPAANYVPYLMHNNLLYISGQLPIKEGALAYSGMLSAEAATAQDVIIDVETGIEASRLCGINILAQARVALGDLDRIEQCIKLSGFVAATADFTDHPKVINGASDLMVAILGDKGRHTRFAVGAASLPLGALVEIDALFAFK